LYIQHSKGIGSVKLKDLSVELQKKYAFDPAKAARVEALQEQSRADFVRSLTNSPGPKPAAPAQASPPPAGQEQGASKIDALPFLNQRGPQIVFEKWLGEAPDVQGKFVLVEFWATWSEPCRKYIPHLNELSRNFGNQMAVIGLSGETEDTVRGLTDPAIEYFSAIDTQQRTAGLAGLRAIPHAILMDPQGIVRFEGHPGALRQEELQKLIAQYSN
jgi:thiol-disulfide isomerase/thioredoxin